MKKPINILFSLFAVLVIVLISSCSGPTSEIETTDEFTGQKLVYQIRKTDSLKHGNFKSFYPEGTIAEEATYQEGKLEGERTLYHENGEVQIKEIYRNGNFEGPYSSYYENGNLESEGLYTDNAMNGEWKFYYPNGQVKEIVRFKDNNEDGPFIEYHENGKLKAEGNYIDGDFEQGELKLYDESGELERIMDCEKGVCRTRWKKEEAEKE